MENKSCYLCSETDIQLCKICSCASSYICIDCLKLTEINLNQMDSTVENRYKCHICRQNLNFDFIPSVRYYGALCKHYLPKLFFLLVDIFIIYAITKFTKTEYPSIFFTHQAMFVFLSLFNIVFVKNACYTFLEHTYNFSNTDFQTQNVVFFGFSIINICITILCFIDSNFQVQDLYFILINCFILGFFFLITSFVVILYRNVDIYNFLKLKYQTLKIKVQHFYFPTPNIDENWV